MCIIIRDSCLHCDSVQYKKNGYLSSGKQNYGCNDWDRQFGVSFERSASDCPDKIIIYRLQAKVSELQSFVGKKANQPWLWRKLPSIYRQPATLRQRMSRLVRAALSVPKKLNNPIVTIKYFRSQFNLELMKNMRWNPPSKIQILEKGA